MSRKHRKGKLEREGEVSLAKVHGILKEIVFLKLVTMYNEYILVFLIKKTTT